MENINFNRIEKKWQDIWEKQKIFYVKVSKKPKFYILEMFPYPSGEGLHMGHALNYTIGDIFSRFKRMNGFNVLYPMGYDSLGLPAENAAIKVGIPPKKYTQNSIKNFIKQQKALGLSYDWSRMLITSNSDYYKWDQWIFLKMFEKKLAYKKTSPVNWCPKCKTVLANEQVNNGKCYLHQDSSVKIKHLNQWYLKITDYADELSDFKEIKEWPDLIKKLQKNWIGKSYGTQIDFEINKKKWPIFTTRIDTIYGATFMVISAQHPKLMDLVTKEHKTKVEDFIKMLTSVSQQDIEQLEKEGIFTGAYATNPISGEKIPVYAGNFVLADYGCGMVMAVPAHDQRDYEFAKKYKIPIKIVIQNSDSSLDNSILKQAYTGDGTLVNSDKFNNLNNREAIDKITKYLEKNKLGKRTINFRLRDWLISRQRYWGAPIPIVNCVKCGAVPVHEKDLPIKLPEKVKFGIGNPLETTNEWIKTKCPNCGGEAKRETDTMDTFVNSSWYYLRFTDPNNSNNIFNSKNTSYWCPIDFYIGGKEHACMHLIYIRFYTKFLRDLGLLNFNEPAKRLFNQGMLHGEDGNKMSKSLGNVINPLNSIKTYSADALRLFLVSVSNPESDMNWDEKGVKSTQKLINNIILYFNKVKFSKSSIRTESIINKSIKLITQDIENLKYNLAIIKLRKLFDSLEPTISKKDFEIFLKLLHPFCPHITEELWEKTGHKPFISLQSWPIADVSKINEKLQKAQDTIDRTITDIANILKIVKEKQNKEVEKIYVYVTPIEIKYYHEKDLSKRVGKEVKIFATNDKTKYDPSGIAKKAKFGKPGIFVE